MEKKPYIPKELPIEINYLEFIKEMADANRSIGRLDGLLIHLPNPRLLGRTLSTKEAVLSSRIEGIQASINDIFEFEAKPDGRKEAETRDIHEIINYRKALDFGVRSLKNLPISENLIKRLHYILLNSGRGKSNAPGEFRKTQVWVGNYSSSIETASYIPPPPNEIILLFSNLEKYINSDSEKSKLVQIAIAHYQFEAIHPFLDGNGRVGRLLISLFLYEKKLLSHPFLYLSEFFEKNRNDYYSLLRNVSENQNWESWIKFFLKGLDIQAQKTENIAREILKLYDDYKVQIIEIRSMYAIKLLEVIFVYPVFSFSLIKDKLGKISEQTILDLIKKFVKAGLVDDISKGAKRNKLYRFTKLFEILKER
jgi:Fic family protein